MRDRQNSSVKDARQAVNDMIGSLRQLADDMEYLIEVALQENETEDDDNGST